MGSQLGAAICPCTLLSCPNLLPTVKQRRTARATEDRLCAVQAGSGRAEEFHAEKEKALDELHAKHAFERA